MIIKQLAPAKLNLGLHVLHRRGDGYHDLETVFIRIPWSDEITVDGSPDLGMTCSDPALPTDASNLCLRSALRLREASGTGQGALIHLEKRVPYGAGLGSGSSDAAATLRALVRLWQLSETDEELHHFAASLGSDVPFFLGPPAAFATGRGEMLEPLSGSDGEEAYQLPYSLVVVVPNVSVSTAEAYRLIEPNSINRPDLRLVVRSNDLERWRAELTNDFEAPVLSRNPSIEAVRRMLLDAGADFVSLSGSGSAMYGVFEDVARAIAAAEAARLVGHHVWHGAQSED